MADTSETAPLTGMAAVKAKLKTNPPGQRSLAWLGRQMQISGSAVVLWGDTVPQDRVAQVARITGLPARVIAPEMAKIFDSEKAA